MEKFGIFELLDTLSALTADKEPAEPTAPAAANKTPGQDEAFAPPAYGAQPAKGRTGADALQGFLSRHDAVARKADGKKS